VQHSLEALVRRIPSKHILFGVMMAALLVTAAVGSVTAEAAPAAQIPGWVITVNGMEVAAADSEQALNDLYDQVVASYEDEDVTALTVLSNVEITACEDVPEDLPREEEDVLTALEEKLSVRTVRQVSETSVLSAGTVTIEDDSLYTDEQEITEGQDGEQLSVSSVISINGQEVLRKLEQLEVTVEPQDTVVRVGTQERPEFIWPTHGSYTGSYGIDTINGAYRRHTGIDIAGSYGTDICAARAGTVVYAGWDNGGYGYLVVIQHDNGTHTYYAHNSSILVSVGDEVEQGQHIAEMGSTGRVTGTHCHFEIRSGTYTGLYVASTINPLNYLKLSDL
jgi:murein DD-endopeptidase MepM/ murein hydrolase activator NlpD